MYFFFQSFSQIPEIPYLQLFQFWRGVDKLELLPSSAAPRQGDEVTVVGYPVGGDNTCVTQVYHLNFFL